PLPARNESGSAAPPRPRRRCPHRLRARARARALGRRAAFPRAAPGRALASSGGVARDVDDLELDPVRVVEEHGVVARNVGVFLRAALDLDARPLAQPIGPLVDGEAGRRLQAEVVQPDPVAVVAAFGPGLRLSQPDRAARSREIPDRLAALA